jgi:predicted ABC-type ATPase
MIERRLVVVGGPNGAGKTTFANAYVARHHAVYLSADAIAAELCPQDPLSIRIEAGKQFVHRLHAALRTDKMLVVESTLSGRSMVKPLSEARNRGYYITLVFVTLDSPELCIARIRERVARGGHFVPDEDVRRRFHRARSYFWQLYRPLADEWQLIGNTGESFELLAIGQGDGLVANDPVRFAQFLRDIGESG